jgi:hypothetical protein
MISFRILIALFTEINEMVEIYLTENNILATGFSCLDPEENPDEKIGR